MMWGMCSGVRQTGPDTWKDTDSQLSEENNTIWHKQLRIGN